MIFVPARLSTNSTDQFLLFFPFHIIFFVAHDGRTLQQTILSDGISFINVTVMIWNESLAHNIQYKGFPPKCYLFLPISIYSLPLFVCAQIYTCCACVATRRTLSVHSRQKQRETIYLVLIFVIAKFISLVDVARVWQYTLHCGMEHGHGGMWIPTQNTKYWNDCVSETIDASVCVVLEWGDASHILRK